MKHIILICKILVAQIVCEIVGVFWKFKTSSDILLIKCEAAEICAVMQYLQNTCRIQTSEIQNVQRHF